MSWAESLVRIADYEVETLQKRLAEIADRRRTCERVLAAQDHEKAQEAAHAREHAEAGLYHAGFLAGWKLRRAKAEADLRVLELEEAGARAALRDAFEAQKKYEKVLERMGASAARATARRESAALDELALRRRAR